MSDSTLQALGGGARPPAQFGHDALVACDNVVRIFQSGSVEVQALQGLDLLVEQGEMVAVVGASGSGKSTLLAVLAGMDAPTAGRVRVGAWDLMAMHARERVAYRREMVGFVWQQTSRNLLPYLTARQNVAVPMRGSRRHRAARAAELLDLVGVGHVAARTPQEMSGGEQQRVAIATALANEPQLLLADEPTGELDTATAREVFDALRTANRESGTTVVVVTHDSAVSGLVERTVAIRDGRTSSEVLRRDAGGDVTHEEYAVMDRAGRLQVPREYREALALTRRVRLALEADHLAVWPDGSTR